MKEVSVQSKVIKKPKLAPPKKQTPKAPTPQPENECDPDLVMRIGLKWRQESIKKMIEETKYANFRQTYRCVCSCPVGSQIRHSKNFQTFWKLLSMTTPREVMKTDVVLSRSQYLTEINIKKIFD